MLWKKGTQLEYVTENIIKYKVWEDFLTEVAFDLKSKKWIKWAKRGRQKERSMHQELILMSNNKL